MSTFLQEVAIAIDGKSVAELGQVVTLLTDAVARWPGDLVLAETLAYVVDTRNAKRDSAPLASAVDGGDEPFSIFKGECNG